MECPICGAIARALRATTFAGRKINCPNCGSYDVSRVVLENHILQRLDRAKRLEVLDERVGRLANKPTHHYVLSAIG